MSVVDNGKPNTDEGLGCFLSSCSICILLFTLHYIGCLGERLQKQTQQEASSIQSSQGDSKTGEESPERMPEATEGDS